MTEKAERTAAVAEAAASLRIELMDFSADDAGLMKAWAEGDMTHAEVEAAIVARAAAAEAAAGVITGSRKAAAAGVR